MYSNLLLVRCSFPRPDAHLSQRTHKRAVRGGNGGSSFAAFSLSLLQREPSATTVRICVRVRLCVCVHLSQGVRPLHSPSPLGIPRNLFFFFSHCGLCLFLLADGPSCCTVLVRGHACATGALLQVVCLCVCVCEGGWGGRACGNLAPFPPIPPPLPFSPICARSFPSPSPRLHTSTTTRTTGEVWSTKRMAKVTKKHVKHVMFIC